MRKDNDATLTNVVQVDFKNQAPSPRLTLDPQIEELNEKKWDLFKSWLSHGVVCVLFDARCEHVKVPPEFISCGDLRLNFSYDFLVPDFNSNEVGVRATLSFDNGEFFCFVPWTSVYGLQSPKLNQGAVWFESFPEDQDPLTILGFSEAMIKDSTPLENQPISKVDNVVKLNFSSKKDQT